jgi:uncharacterized protein YkwD
MSPSTLIRLTLAVAATFLGLVALSTPTQAATAVSASGFVGSPNMDPAKYERRVKYWINVKRERHGLRKVRFNRCSDNLAESWSAYLAKNFEFYHQSMDPLLNKCNAVYAGETLARGLISPRKTVRLWMQSSGHRHIILSKYPNRVGIGATVDAEGRWLTAADFIKKP